MRLSTLITAVVVLAILIGLHRDLNAESRPQSVAVDQDKAKLAIDVVRVINTAQWKYRQRHGTYAAWPDLGKSGELTEAVTTFSSDAALANIHFSEQPEILPGWNLRLRVSADSKSYGVALEDATDKKCSYAVVSDERGLIRQALAIDCSL